MLQTNQPNTGLTTNAQAASPTTATTTTAPHVPSQVVLENLAARFRPGGLFLLMLKPDGTVAYHDATAGTFFTRYVLPMLQYPERTDTALGGKMQQLNASSSVGIWDALPGVLLAAFPYVDKRQLQGILVLGAKSNAFKL